MLYKKSLLIAASALLSITATSNSMNKRDREIIQDKDIKTMWAKKLYTQNSRIIDIKECPLCEKEIKEIHIQSQDLFECEPDTCVTLQGSIVHTDNTQCNSIPVWSFDTQKNNLTKIEKQAMPQQSGGNFYLSAYLPRNRSSSLVVRSLENPSNSQSGESYIEVGKTNTLWGLEEETLYNKLPKQLKTEHKLEFKAPQKSTVSSKNALSNALIVAQPYTKELNSEKQCLSLFGAYPCEFLCTLTHLNPADEEKVCCNKNGSIVCYYNHKNRCLTVFKQLHGLGEVSGHYCDVVINTQNK